MPICPKCGHFIDHVIEDEKVWVRRRLSVDEKGEPDYEQEELPSNETGDAPEIMCPECENALFDEEGLAILFLKACPKQEMRKKCDTCKARFKCWTERYEK